MDEKLQEIVADMQAKGKSQELIDAVTKRYHERQANKPQKAPKQILPEQLQTIVKNMEAQKKDPQLIEAVKQRYFERNPDQQPIDKLPPQMGEEMDLSFMVPGGQVLKHLPGYDEFEDIIIRGYLQGVDQRKVASEMGDILVGQSDDPEDMKQLSEAYFEMQKNARLLETDEQRAFNKQIAEGGDTLGNSLLAVAKNPTAAFTSLVSSMVAMINPYSLGTGAATAGAVVGTGAAAGTIGGPVGTAVGAALSTPAAITAGWSTASGMTDALVSSVEYMEEELEKQGLESTPENLEALMKDGKAMGRVRSRALARGAAISVVNMLTFKASGAVASRVGKSALRPRTMRAVQLAATTGVEVPGEGVGELVAQVAADENISPSQVVLEAAGGFLDVPVSTLTNQMNIPEYKTKNAPAMSKKDFLTFVKDAPLSEVQEMAPSVKNDPEVEAEMNNILYERNTKSLIQEAHPSFDDKKVNKIFGIQKKLAALEGQETDIAKEEKKALTKKLQEELGYAEKKEGETTAQTTKKAEPKKETKTPAQKVKEGVQAEQKAKEITKEDEAVTDEEDIDSDIDPITRLFGPQESLEEQLNPTEKLEEESAALGKELAERGAEEGFVGSKEYNEKLKRFQEIDATLHKRKNQPKFSVEERNSNFIGEKNVKAVPVAKVKDLVSNMLPHVKGKKIGSAITGQAPKRQQAMMEAAKAGGKQALPHPTNPGESIVFDKGQKVENLVSPAEPNLPGLNINAPFFMDSIKPYAKKAGFNKKLADQYFDAYDKRVNETNYGVVSQLDDVATEDLVKVLEYLTERGYNVRQTQTKHRGVSVEFTKAPDFNISEAATKLSRADKNYIDKVGKVLQKAFPGIEYISDPVQYYEAVRNYTLEGVNIPNNAKGFLYEGKVYINPKKATKDTPFHEFAHVWARALAIHNRRLFNRGHQLLKGTEYMKTVDQIPYYKRLKKTDPQAFIEEVMANALGKHAAQIFAEQEGKSPLRQWLEQAVNWLKNRLGISSKKGYEDLTLQDWLDVGAKSIITGDQTAAQTVGTDTGLALQQEITLKGDKFDRARARKQVQYREFKQKGLKPEKGWSKDPKYAAMIDEQIAKNQQRAVKKTEVKAAPKKEEVETTKEFKKATKMIEKFKKANARRLGQGDHKVFKNLDNEALAIGMAKGLNKIEETGTPIAQLVAAIGYGTKYIPDEGTSFIDEKKNRFVIAADLIGMLMDEGVLGHEYNFQTGSNEIVVVQDGFLDEMSELVGNLPQDEKEPGTVFVGAPPAKYEGMKHESGQRLVSRYHPQQQMTPEDYPDVYKVVNNASEVGYELDLETLDLLKTLQKEGLLLDTEGLSAAQVKAKNREIETLIQAADKVADQEFYTLHDYDYRGRLYSTAFGLDHQGSKKGLALFRFKDKAPIGKNGYKWMNINATDYYGYAGDTLQDREQYALDQQATWIEWAKDPKKFRDEILKAEEPMLFYTAIKEIQRAVESGDPLTFESGLPIHMDATNSGGQILSALSHDKQGASMVNLNDTDTRADLYVEVAQEVYKEIPAKPTPAMKQGFLKIDKHYKDIKKRREEANKIEDFEQRKAKHQEISQDDKAWKEANTALFDEGAKYFWGQPNVRKKMRKIAKKPIMTKYYSAKPAGISSSIFDEWKDNPAFDGINHKYTYWMAKRLYEAADRKMPGPGKIMDNLIDVGLHLFNEGSPLIYHTPVNNFKVVQDPKQSVNVPVYVKSGETNIEVSMAFDTPDMSRNKVKSQTAPNVVHSYDSQLVAWFYMNAGYPVQTIHDSFATNPANAENMYNDVRKAFVDIFGGKPLLKMLEEALGDKQMAKAYFDQMYKGTWNPKGILNNQYAFSAGESNPALSNIETTAGNAQDTEIAFSFEEDSISDALDSKADLTKLESKPCK